MSAVRHTQAQLLEKSLRDLRPASPKRRRGQDESWFDYYAGYADAFVTEVMATFAGQASSVLDPWNGAGTTTAAAARSGLRAVGLDVNPAANVIAKARLLASDVSSSLDPLAKDLIIHAGEQKETCDSSDLLLRWLMPVTAAHVRHFDRAIRNLLVPVATDGAVPRSVSVDDVSSLAAVFYLALFRTARELFAPFFASNPTWIRLRVAPSDRVRAHRSTIDRRFMANVKLLSEVVGKNHQPSLRPPSEIKLGSSSKIPLRKASVGAVLLPPLRIAHGLTTPSRPCRNSRFLIMIGSLCRAFVLDSSARPPCLERRIPPLQRR